MNLVEIAGHLGADPETRMTANGLKVTNLRVATSSRRAGKDETIWWRVTIFGDRFDKLMTYLKKGSAVIVIGEMNKPEIWTDKEGRPQVNMEMVAEIVRFSPFGNKSENKQEGNGIAHNPQQQYSQQQYAPQQQQQYASAPANNYPDQSYNDSSFQQPNYGGNSYNQPAGNAMGSTQPEEDLPF